MLWPSASFWVTHAVERLGAVPHAFAAPLLEDYLPDTLRSLVGEGRLIVRTRIGRPLDILLEEAVALNADLMLVGTAGDRRRTLTRNLAMKAPCSVWMVPVGAVPRLNGVLAAVDFSPRSADSLRVATALAAAAGLERCDVLHVRFDPATAGYDEYNAAVYEREQYEFALFAGRIETHGVELRPMLRESGDLPLTIVRTAADCGSDVIVMGTRGRSRASAVILGSETEHVLTASPIPVLAVKHFGTQLRLLDALSDRPRRGHGDPKFT